MGEGMPNASSSYAQEGTALHAVSSHCLESGQDAVEWIDRPFKFEDHGEAATIEIDEDQADAVQVYLDVIRKDQAERGGKLLVETRFHLDWLHPEFFGTGDCSRLGTDNVLCVYDAKFGKGKIVEAFKVVDGKQKPNPQLAYYGIGAVEALKRVMASLKIDKIELIVVQPRAHHAGGPVRRVTVTHDELLDLSADLVEAAENALSDEPRIKTGGHCTFCPGAARCKALRDVAMETAQLDFDDEKGIVKPYGEKTVNPLDLTPQQLANALDAADLIDAWVSAVRMHAHILADRQGVELPGWVLTDKRATRRWKDEENTKAELCFNFGLDENSIYSQKLKSPAQIEKLFPKDERAALAELYAKESSGTKLVRASGEHVERQPSVQTDFDDDQSSDW